MRLLPREEKFFHFFQQQADLILEAAQLLHEGARKGNHELSAAAAKIAVLETRGDEIIHEIFTRLNSTFITPIDPEDIHSLGSHLDDVLDGLEECSHRVVAYRIDPIPAGIVEMCRILESCAISIRAAFEALANDKQLLSHCIDINRLEDDADKVVRGSVADLLTSQTDAITVIKLKEIYDYLEQTADYCEDVADVLQNVVVKNG